jgi:RNA polymerase sigma-70 factor, ECF subfamily
MNASKSALVVQDAFLRWREVDRERITEPRAYLARVVSRLCLDCMGSASRRREQDVVAGAGRCRAWTDARR